MRAFRIDALAMTPAANAMREWVRALLRDARENGRTALCRRSWSTFDPASRGALWPMLSAP